MSRSINELVLPPDISDDLRIRAILLSVSSSAKHSALLQGNAENAKDAIQVAGAKSLSSFKFLPSPYNSSSDEDEDQSPRERRRCNSRQVFLVLKQSLNTEKFTFGTSKDSDVILEHPNSFAEVCYINFVHLELYPDPERDGLKLCNKTLSSTFSAESFSNSEVNTIPPGQGLYLADGSWRLNIGQGLDFQIKILPRRNHKPYHDWILIHRSTSGLLNTTRGGELKARAKTTVLEKSVGIKINKETSKTNKVPTKYIPEKCKAATKDGFTFGESDKGGPKDLITEKDTRIYHNEVTQIFKATRNGLELAIKLCRHKEVDRSAVAWKNEVNILKKLARLDHPSIVKLIDYDAELLSLGLEFIGPNLSHYKDQNDMSTISNEVQDRILVDISKGIECIHNEGIMHLDIKPENILIGDRRAVLCDFGASQIGRRGGTVIQFIKYNGGTPCYTPPEYMVVANKDRNRGFEGDIYAFGVTMAWVSRVFPLPRKKWIIADIMKDSSAFTKMLEWINFIESVRKALPEASLIRAMLERNPNSRITAPQLAQKSSTQQAERVCKPYLLLHCIQSIGRQALSGVEYLQFKSVMRRDLKPENILVTKWDVATDIPNIKLADFSLAAIGPEHKTFCSSKGYVAPEVEKINNMLKKLKKQKDEGMKTIPRNQLLFYTNAVDIWPLGKILKKLVDDIPWRISLHRGKTALVDKTLALSLTDQMMQEDPNDRPTATKCLKHPWMRNYNSISPIAKKRDRPLSNRTSERPFKTIVQITLGNSTTTSEGSTMITRKAMWSQESPGYQDGVSASDLEMQDPSVDSDPSFQDTLKPVR